MFVSIFYDQKYIYLISIIILIGHDGRVVKGAVLRVNIFQVTIPGSNPGSDSMLFDLCLHQYSTIKSIYISFLLLFSSVTMAEWSKALYIGIRFFRLR